MRADSLREMERVSQLYDRALSDNIDVNNAPHSPYHEMQVGKYSQRDKYSQSGIPNMNPASVNSSPSR